MVTLLLPPEKESEFRISLALDDRLRAKEILEEAIEPTLDLMLAKQAEKPRDFEAALAELDRVMDSAFEGRERPQLPDKALTRAEIYGDHP